MKAYRILSVIPALAILLGGCGSQMTGSHNETGSTTSLQNAGGSHAASGDVPATREIVEDVELVIWHTLTDHHQATMEKIIADFNASQDRITVIAQAQPYQDFDSKLMQAVRNGVGPDLVRTFPSNVVNYAAEDLIVDFAPYINDPGIGMPDFKGNIPEGIYEEITQWGDDQIYLLPTQITGEIFFYNKTLYDKLGLKAPKTWTELEENSRIIFEATGKPAFGADSAVDHYIDLIMQSGSPLIDAGAKKSAFNQEIGVEKLAWFARNVQDGIFRLVGEDQYFSNPFGSQAVASYIGSSAGVQYVEGAVAGQFEFATAPIPQEGPVKFFPSWMNGFVAFKSDPAKERAAYEFYKFHAKPEVMAEWTIAFGAVPVFYDAIETAEYQEYMNSNIAIQALAPQLEYVGFIPSIPGVSSVRNHLQAAIEAAALGTKTPAQALDEAEAASNRDLKG
ncbi:extracellular solute-binding protein [Cohnella hongkongensis]|uniref:Extracellular solute-binding protein n=1 Tax=Cohnella hongkongensis TaxID=178337 RepID=A0ABV9FAF3_9BACL